MRYIAFLRGINVGGRKSVKMEDLRRVITGMGYGNVQTYIQSGNVIFDAENDEATIRREIEVRLAAVFGFPISAILRTAEELSEVVESSPYGHELSENEKVSVTLLSAEPDTEAVEAVQEYAGDSTDDYSIRGREVYILTRSGYAGTAYSNGFFEKVFKVKATTRNIEVLKKILELVES